MTDSDKTAPDWAIIRHEAEKNIGTEAEIQARHGITKGQFDHRKRAEDWERRRAVAGVSRATIVRKMFRVLNAQINRLERDLQNTGPNEAALLGSLATTLGKLIEFEKTRGTAHKAPTAKVVEDLRYKIAVRIEQLNQG